MPLEMPRKSDAWDGFRDVVAFPAEDSVMNTPVGCAISEQALIAHFGALNGNIASLLGAFRRYRTVIERAASKKYDTLGKPSILVLTPEDFTVPAEDANPTSRSKLPNSGPA